jgi:mRNA interferase RelE/StbE
VVNYSIELKEQPIFYLEKSSKEIAQRIFDKIKWLSENFDGVPHIALKGERWRGAYKLRSGNYRIIYSCDKNKKIITIHLIGDRKEIYSV